LGFLKKKKRVFLNPGIERISWRAKSPDLNPIEILWDYIGRALARRHPPPRTENALKRELLEERR